MIYIEHRINTMSALQGLDPLHGAEIDLRSHGRELILAHDPFKDGQPFAEWLQSFAAKKPRGPLILNTKEDLLEADATRLLNQNGIDDFLFLDTALPTLVKASRSPQASHYMARLSAYEPLEAALRFKGSIPWLWVDCFDGAALEPGILEAAQRAFKLCLVSPELHGADLESALEPFAKLATHCQAICTKHPAIWKKRLARL